MCLARGHSWTDQHLSLPNIIYRTVHLSSMPYRFVHTMHDLLLSQLCVQYLASLMIPLPSSKIAEHRHTLHEKQSGELGAWVSVSISVYALGIMSRCQIALLSPESRQDTSTVRFKDALLQLSGLVLWLDCIEVLHWGDSLTKVGFKTIRAIYRYARYTGSSCKQSEISRDSALDGMCPADFC